MPTGQNTPPTPPPTVWVPGKEVQLPTTQLSTEPVSISMQSESHVSVIEMEMKEVSIEGGST